VYFKSIDEKVGFIDSINSNFESAIAKLEKTVKMQSLLIFSIILLLFVAVLVYSIKALIIPMVRERRMKAREDPVKMLRYLIRQLKESPRDKEKAEKIYARMKHFYKYLSDEEKKKVHEKIESIERYIN